MNEILINLSVVIGFFAVLMCLIGIGFTLQEYKRGRRKRK